MKIAAELTSILQVLFVLSLIKKISHSDEDLSVDFLYLNRDQNIMPKTTTPIQTQIQNINI